MYTGQVQYARALLRHYLRLKTPLSTTTTQECHTQTRYLSLVCKSSSNCTAMHYNLVLVHILQRQQKQFDDKKTYVKNMFVTTCVSITNIRKQKSFFHIIYFNINKCSFIIYVTFVYFGIHYLLVLPVFESGVV